MRLPKKFAACLMACALLGTYLLSVQASNISSIQQQIQQNQNALGQVNEQLSKYEAERKEYQRYLDDQKSEMINLMKDIVYFEQAVDSKQDAIEQATVDLEAAEVERQAQFEAMMVHIQYMYERGDDNMLAMLLSSDGFTDMLNRAEYADSLYEYDRAILTNYENLVSDIATMRNTLEEEKREYQVQQTALEGQRVELERIMDELKDTISDYDDLVKQAKDKANAYKKQIASGEKQIEIIKKQQQQQQQQQGNSGSGSNANNSNGGSSNNSSSGGGAQVSGSGTGAEIAQYALQFVGNPYVWGGVSLTNGADCSGFIMSVYAQYGYALPHSSYSMRSIGTGVELSEAQAGDIICYSGHVGLYIGNGQIVHAKGSEYGIVTDPVYYGWGGTGPKVLAVRRIIK